MATEAKRCKISTVGNQKPCRRVAVPIAAYLPSLRRLPNLLIAHKNATKMLQKLIKNSCFCEQKRDKNATKIEQRRDKN